MAGLSKIIHSLKVNWIILTPNKKRQGLVWSKIFVIDTDVNTKVKGKKKVDSILKPDTEDYHEDELLEYDCNMHIFVPNSGLDPERQERVKEMILKLGGNFVGHKAVRHSIVK